MASRCACPADAAPDAPDPRGAANAPRPVFASTSFPWACVVLIAGALAGLAGVHIGSARAGSPASQRSCYGAASRDPLQRCVNTALRLTVAPTPAQALRAPNAPCRATSRPFGLYPCVFGTGRESAVSHIALIGDSHASHWRAALSFVTASRGWNGTSLTKTGCPFTMAPLAEVGRSGRACRRWAQQVTAWLRRHDEVETVFISDHAGARVKVAKGSDPFEAQVAGYKRAWETLPSSVRHLIVIRDVPLRRQRTLQCVKHAMAVRKPAGTACAVARHTVLQRDPGMRAAAELHRAGVSRIDLSEFFCSPRLCFPVVGGALVIKDQNHMTTAFAGTLGPFLLRAVNTRIPAR